jgi:hypothetical protein
MAKTLEKVLKTDMSRLPLRKAAEQLRKKGRGRDTVLAHITPREAARLKAEGGSGTINPDTGLPEFDDGLYFDPTPAAYQPADFSSYEPPSYTPDTITQGPAYQSPTQDYTFLSQPGQGFQQPYQAAQYTGGFQQDFGGEFSIPGQYASSNPDVQNAYRTAGQPLPPDVAAMAYGGTSPVEYVQSGDARDNALTLQMLGKGNAQSPVAPVQTDVAKLTGESQAQPEEQDLGKGDREVKAPSAPGTVKTPFGNIAIRDLIAALGVGGMGLSYLNAQNQGKKAAGQLQGAYNQAAQQQMQLAQPYMQQGGTQLAGALTGALSPAQQQQLQAAQAAAAQGTSGAGGAGAAQAGRSIEDLRQRLLSNQQTMALQLLGAGTPLIGQAIQNQLSGTTTGINTQMQLSQQAGQAATGMLGMLAMMYGRSA